MMLDMAVSLNVDIVIKAGHPNSALAETIRGAVAGAVREVLEKEKLVWTDIQTTVANWSVTQ